MVELEDQLSEIEATVVQENMKKVVLTENQIKFFLNRLKDGDVDDLEYQQRVMYTFIHDDKIIVA